LIFFTGIHYPNGDAVDEVRRVQGGTALPVQRTEQRAQPDISKTGQRPDSSDCEKSIWWRLRDAVDVGAGSEQASE
jgi:hypothetical protein